MLIEAANVGALARFPWTLAPAVAIFLMAMSANALTSERDSRRLESVRAPGADSFFRTVAAKLR
jgi:hypothetical protein